MSQGLVYQLLPKTVHLFNFPNILIPSYPSYFKIILSDLGCQEHESIIYSSITIMSTFSVLKKYLYDTPLVPLRNLLKSYFGSLSFCMMVNVVLWPLYLKVYLITHNLPGSHFLSYLLQFLAPYVAFKMPDTNLTFYSLKAPWSFCLYGQRIYFLFLFCIYQ